jgi:hypothetical protein
LTRLLFTHYSTTVFGDPPPSDITFDLPHLYGSTTYWRIRPSGPYNSEPNPSGSNYFSYVLFLTSMAGRYERVNTQDDDPDTPISPSSLRPQRIPNSPPPSFHSRASSIDRRRQNVDSDLADAFDTDGDNSDDEPDDRQRLMRHNSVPVPIFPVSHGTAASGQTSTETRPSAGQQTTQWSSTSPAGHSTLPAGNSRIYGGGIQSDGVFSNLSARPERGEKVVEEAPPVCALFVPLLVIG